MKTKCDKYDNMFNKVKQSEKVHNVIKQHKPLFEYLTIHSGSNISTIEDVEFLYNTLEIEQLHNLTLPNWLNATILQTMRGLGALNLALYSDTEYMKRMKGGQYLSLLQHTYGTQSKFHF